MLKVFTSFFKLAHAFLITYICIRICTQSPRLCLRTIFLELAFTVLSIFITKKHFLDVLQIVISLFLTYALIPNNYSFLVGLFFFKIIYVYNSLGEVIDDVFSAPGNHITRLLQILVRIFRYTLVQYLFLGLILLGYKIWTIGDTEGTLPEDYVLLYKLVVTATTIGYGDITPKSKCQITYFTYFIPFICASFVLYFNAVIPIFGQLTDVLSGNPPATIDEGCNAGTEALQSKIWNTQQKESFINFVDQVSKRQAEHEEHHKRLGHNWIALSATHYERQIPLITNILKGDENKEVKLKVSSKVRRQFYPSGWTILQAGDVSEDYMMVDEGQVQTPALQGKGFVFNRQGFISKAPSKSTVVAKGFVAVWAISLKDIEQLSKTSAKIQQVIAEGLRE